VAVDLGRLGVHECAGAQGHTEHDTVRTTIANYLNDLLSLAWKGSGSTRPSTSNPADIAGVEAKLTRPAYLYQEVIYGAGEAVQPQQYESTGDLLEFRYGANLKAKFSGGTCTGPVITVDGNGNAAVTVGGMDAVAIHTGSKITGSGWSRSRGQ
jgi:hypothetical protein